MTKRLYVFIFLSIFMTRAQEAEKFGVIDVGYVYGSILRHNKDIAYLIRARPQGSVIGYNKKTCGRKK